MTAPDNLCADPAAGSLEALQADAVLRLQCLVDAAALDVCPLAAAAMRRPRESMQLTHACTGPDVLWRAPVAAWQHLQNVARTAVSSCDDAPCVSLSPHASEEVGIPTLRLVTLSKFGTTRVRLLSSAAQVAELLLETLPSPELSQLVADFRVQAGGSVSFTTSAAFTARSAAGLLLCRHCARWFGGLRGLRTHLQVAHAAGYESSRLQAEDTRRALIACATPRELVMLSASAALVSKVSSAAKRALHPGLVAARDGDVEVLRALVDGDFDPSVVCDHHGSTALMWAAGGGHAPACAYLLDTCGVDATYAQPDGRTAIMWAARNGHLHICKLLEQSAPGVAQAATRDGTTALHWACWQGHIPVCEWLVDGAGCDLHALNLYGCNASQWAAQSGDIAMLAWLLQRGLDVGIINHNGHSALHKAAIKGKTGACEWLLTTAHLGARHMGADSDGNTPQRMAAAEGHLGLAAALQAHFARLSS
jgi:ankyrin repeat protein